jgi:hypothetical protein
VSFVLVALAAAWSTYVNAACASPAGAEGSINYDISSHAFRYCGDTDTRLSMLELVLTVCTIVQGAACRSELMVLQNGASMVACMMASQIEGAKWVQEHPNYYIQKATCRPAKIFADT